MNQKTRSFLALTKASFKMYYRNKGAIIFSLLLPVALMSIFGFLSKGTSNALKLGITNHAKTELAIQFIDALKKVEAFKVIEESEEQARAELGKGDLDLQIIIPENFGVTESGQVQPGIITTRYNKAKPQSGRIASMIITQIITGFDKQLTHATTILEVKSEGIAANSLDYFDFILPGLLSMTIMQLGIFGVAFSFVALKASGALRRIQATPVHPIYFVLAQATVRLLVSLASVFILVALGTYFFNFHMVGSYVTFGLITVTGILIFLGVGFAIAGWAKDETQVAPVANLIQLPLLLLSGIFFPRDGFPGWLKNITDYFPLTYVSHALRKVANEGMTFADIPVDIVGMFVWLIIVYAVAIKLFRWE